MSTIDKRQIKLGKLTGYFLGYVAGTDLQCAGDIEVLMGKCGALSMWDNALPATFQTRAQAEARHTLDKPVGEAELQNGEVMTTPTKHLVTLPDGVTKQDVRDYRALLNRQDAFSNVKHQHGRYRQRTRKYGDYLWHQDRDRLVADTYDWVQRGRPSYG